jgi:diguanylate cyclase (GGDEF)-like protein/PAS domain S-box-containing protein
MGISHPEQALRALENTHGALPERLPSVAYIFESGLEGRCLYISPSVEAVLGYPRDEWVQDHDLWASLLHPDDVERVLAGEDNCVRTGEISAQEYRLQAADGRFIWIRDEMSLVPGHEPGQEPLFYGVFLDVSERKRVEAKLERMALYDPVTGLPNRALFTERLGLALAGRSADSSCSVCFIDIDRFKRINDSLGHEAGNQVLDEIARRLTAVLRPDDTLARIGADEFAILCNNVGGVLEAIAIADRVQAPLGRPLRTGGADIRLSASIGVSIAEPGDDGDATRLIEDAEAAMYRAKLRGGSRAELFDAEMRESAVSAVVMEEELQRAIDRGELRLFYQPILDLASGIVVGAEALVRWQHPERGLLSPDKFLGLAEESGLIVPLGAWVVNEACIRLADWKRRDPDRPMKLQVNLGARELTHPDAVTTVLGAMRRCGVAPANLCIEVTEGTAMVDGDSGFQALRELSGEGLPVAIDDFGTGYSCLNQLRRMPVDIVKIDRCFVNNMVDSPTDRELVGAMIGMARALDLAVVAEGIETEEQATILRDLGVDFAQGFLFARPLPPEELDDMLTAGVSF